jgi:hypothetical protein
LSVGSAFTTSNASAMAISFVKPLISSRMSLASSAPTQSFVESTRAISSRISSLMANSI